VVAPRVIGFATLDGVTVYRAVLTIRNRLTEHWFDDEGRLLATCAEPFVHDDWTMLPGQPLIGYGESALQLGLR
jgi:hypothetical protein